MTASLRLLLASLFFVSGFSGLVLQTVWTRMMILVFGSTTFAVSTVLTAFMGGLALGSIIAARRAHGLRGLAQGAKIYGGLELIIGVYALLLPSLFGLLPALQAALVGDSSS